MCIYNLPENRVGRHPCVYDDHKTKTKLVFKMSLI